MPANWIIHEFLKAAGVPYTLIAHRPTYTAQEDAAAAHVPGRGWAKVVICLVDGEPVQAVLPAPSIVDLDRLLELTAGSEIRVAEAEELDRLFPDCERGTMPPLGSLYGYPVFVDVSLAAEPTVFFNAGTHSIAVAMRWADFARIVKPIVGSFAEPSREHVPAFRLSYRE